jgi:spore coat polysaccharide biosynthesis protein SpsF
MQSDVVVEVCGDTPLLDPHVIDMAIATFFANDCDVVSNTRHLSFPQGVDAQIFRRADLEEVEHTVKDPAVREHVSLFFYEHPERYRIVHLMAPPCWQGPQLRFQVDYREDLEFVRAIYGRLEPALGTAFATGDILELLRREPHLAEINSHCQEKPVR